MLFTLPVSSPMTSCLPRTLPALRLPVSSSFPAAIHLSSSDPKKGFVVIFLSVKCLSDFLRRLRPFTRNVLFPLRCVRGSSATTKRSSSLFWMSLQLVCHVAFRSLTNNPISHIFVSSFHFDPCGVSLSTVLECFDCLQWTVVPTSARRSLASLW